MRQNNTMAIDTAELPEPTDPEDMPPVNTNPGWLSEDELAFVRGRMPVLYVEAVPVRVDGQGQVLNQAAPVRFVLLHSFR